MSKKTLLITKILSIFIYMAVAVVVFIVLGKHLEFDTSKSIAAIVGLCGLAKLLVYFVNLDYLKIKNLHAGIVNLAVVIIAFVFLFGNFEAKGAATAFAICDIALGVSGLIISIICFPKYHLDISEVFLGIGDIVFGILLLIEGPEGIHLHLTYETVFMFVTATVIGMELELELRKEPENK